jgi:prepilin-type processing-associated H-X9-DG protein
MNKRTGLSLGEVILIASILMIVFVVLISPLRTGDGRASRKAASAQNNRQMALSAIMYSGDYDDRIPITINGPLARMQNVADGMLTVNSPSAGTQDLASNDAAGGERADAWPLLLIPYIKSRGLFTDPGRADIHNIWSMPAKAKTEPGYDAEGATFRNQNRFPFYGVNYMYLAPLRIPKNKRALPNAINYAVSETHKFSDADDPSGTVFFTESQHSMLDTTRGFFVINAPGMWPAFEKNKDGYVTFWTGTAGSGDWSGAKATASTNFVYTGYNNGCNVSFLDGHVKYFHTALLAAGTDYLTASPQSDGSGARIVDKTHYLWNLSNKNFYGM